MRQWINLIEGAAGFPTRSFDFLLHVGSLNAAEKRKDSHEGAGLSVSLHPNAWQQIARGWVSGDMYRLTKPHNQFLDYHSLDGTQRQTIVEWGIAQGYVTPLTSFRVTYYDGDLDEERYQEFESREEAEFENGEIEGEITEHQDSFIMTPKLAAYCHLSGNHYVNCLDYLSLAYAEYVLGLDGVWWEDTLDVQNYSAPRGVIFPARVHTFKVEEPHEDDADDESQW